MRVANFFNPVEDVETLDLSTKVTVPDLSLSVRDILNQYHAGSLELSPIEYGDDEDIDEVLNDFDDFVDAQNALREKVKIEKPMFNNNSPIAAPKSESEESAELATSAPKLSETE